MVLTVDRIWKDFLNILDIAELRIYHSAQISTIVSNDTFKILHLLKRNQEKMFFSLKRSVKYIYVTTYALYMAHCYQDRMMIRLQLYVLTNNAWKSNWCKGFTFCSHILCQEKDVRRWITQQCYSLVISHLLRFTAVWNNIKESEFLLLIQNYLAINL